MITGDADNFSVGANVMLLLMSVQEEEWDDVDLAIRQFQGMTQAIKFSAKPVVVAPFGLTLGGGSRDFAARRGAAAACRALYGAGGSRSGTAARWRRLQGNAAAGDG